MQTRSSSGLTLIELTITLGIIVILASVLLLVMEIPELEQKARDNKRLSDIATIERIINEYANNAKSFPGIANTTYASNVIPDEEEGQDILVSGWIYADFTLYSPTLPIDPKNTDNHVYSYRHNGKAYEINAFRIL